MKVKTASTRRSIDKWKGRARGQVRRSQTWGMELVSRLVLSSRRGKFALVPPLLAALSFNFVTAEFVILLLVGYFILKLHCYRLVNSLMRLLPSPR